MLPNDRLISPDDLRALTSAGLRERTSNAEMMRVWREHGHNSLADVNLYLCFAEDDRRTCGKSLDRSLCVVDENKNDEERVVTALRSYGYGYRVVSVEQHGSPGVFHRWVEVLLPHRLADP